MLHAVQSASAYTFQDLGLHIRGKSTPLLSLSPIEPQRLCQRCRAPGRSDMAGKEVEKAGNSNRVPAVAGRPTHPLVMCCLTSSAAKGQASPLIEAAPTRTHVLISIWWDQPPGVFSGR